MRLRNHESEHNFRCHPSVQRAGFHAHFRRPFKVAINQIPGQYLLFSLIITSPRLPPAKAYNRRRFPQSSVPHTEIPNYHTSLSDHAWEDPPRPYPPLQCDTTSIEVGDETYGESHSRPSISGPWIAGAQGITDVVGGSGFLSLLPFCQEELTNQSIVPFLLLECTQTSFSSCLVTDSGR